MAVPTEKRKMFRPHRGHLNDAMAEAREIVPTIAAVCKAVRETHTDWPVVINERVVTVTRYGGPDRRIGWRKTYMVRVGKVPFGFTNFDPYREDT